MDNQKRKLTNNDESAVKKKKGKVIILEMKFKSNVDGVRDEIASQRNVDTATI